MKVWLFLVLVLIVLSCEAGKKKKKKTSSSNNLKNLFLRRRPTARPTTEPTKPPPVQVKKVNLKNIDFTSINTTDQFYEVFNLPRLKQHGHGSGGVGSDHSTAMQDYSEWGCKFRPTLVHLPAPPYGRGFIFPSCATVNRCSGCCGVSNLECKPVGVTKVQVDYYHFQPNGSYTETSRLVDEHLGCACQCSQTADSCLKTQFLNPGLCQCECLPQNQEDALDCPQKGNFQYDPKTCSCVCKTVRHCDHDPNLRWSDEDCACVCKKQKCPSRQYLDKNTCQCVSGVLGQRQ